MNRALYLPAYPVTEGCIGGIAELEHTQPWIYGLDNPYLHGVYAPTTLELAESGLRVPADLTRMQRAGIRNGLIGEHLMRQPDPGAALRTLLSGS